MVTFNPEEHQFAASVDQNGFLLLRDGRRLTDVSIDDMQDLQEEVRIRRRKSREFTSPTKFHDYVRNLCSYKHVRLLDFQNLIRDWRASSFSADITPFRLVLPKIPKADAAYIAWHWEQWFNDYPPLTKALCDFYPER